MQKIITKTFFHLIKIKSSLYLVEADANPKASALFS